MWLRRAVFAVLCVWFVAGPAVAGDLDDFNAAMEKAQAHHRLALGYLRSDKIDLATYEIERMREAWDALVGQFGPKPPAALAGNELYVVTLTDVSTRLVTALIMINIGRPDIAHDALEPVGGALSQLQQAVR